MLKKRQTGFNKVYSPARDGLFACAKEAESFLPKDSVVDGIFCFLSFIGFLGFIYAYLYHFLHS